jgi:hypothetical protein
MIRAALDYAARGWPVLPLRPGTKLPLTEHGLHDATTDEAQVREWWRRCPRANVGLRTGLAFDVLDVDGDEGLKELSALIGGDEVELPAGPAVATPSGGLHVYFRPTGLGNRARFRKGLDWRGSGGYVVAPPSLLPRPAYYSWWPVPETVDSPLEDAPGWLSALVKREPTAPAPQPIRTRSTRYAVAALESEAYAVAAAPPGTRNDRLNRAAHAVGRFVAAGDLDRGAVETILMAAARECGLPEFEARRTIGSALRARGVA